MFLKQDTFNYGNQSVVLNELSGLQRVEYLAYARERAAQFDEASAGMEEGARQIAFMEMGMDINAWLVSRSLWNAEQSKDVAALFSSVRVTWSWDALGMAAESILALSGMALTVATEGDGVKEALTPEKS